MRTLVLTFLLAAGFFATAEEGNPAKSEACLAPGEKIYQPGMDHVKPPELIPVSKKREPPANSRQVTLDVLLNSQGTICEVHVLRSTNVENARKVAENVAQNFRFKPATRYGNPVAVRLVMNFNLRE